MKTSVKVVLITVIIAVLAFLSNAVGPLGGFWRPAPDAPTPTGIQFVLYAFLLAFEALTLGLGVSFLLFGFPLVKAISTASPALTRLTHLSFAWLLLNWWAHGSLHLHVGMPLSSLLAIEYGFHFTIIVSGLVELVPSGIVTSILGGAAVRHGCR